MNERYKEFLASAPSPAEARRRIVEYACEHGTTAAARMSGADQTTVARILQRGDALAPRRHSGGKPRLAPEDEARIIDARLAHPEAGVIRLKRDHGLPHGGRQIMRVLNEAGLVPECEKPIRDPAFWIRWRERRVETARLELMVAEVVRKAGATGRIAEVERLRRGVARAKRKVEWWKKKARHAGTATAFNAESAEDGGPQRNGNIKLPDVLGGLSVLGVEGGAMLTATAFNAESAENGGLRGNGNIKLPDVLGGLGVLGVEGGATFTATALNAEHAEHAEKAANDKPWGSGYVSLRDMLADAGGLDALGRLGVE
jgi:hypothetical protein